MTPSPAVIKEAVKKRSLCVAFDCGWLLVKCLVVLKIPWVPEEFFPKVQDNTTRIECKDRVLGHCLQHAWHSLGPLKITPLAPKVIILKMELWYKLGTN